MFDKNVMAQMLSRHENRKLFPYTDTVGKLTIGVGRNLTDRGISESECAFMLDNDINDAITECVKHIPGFATMSDQRKYAFVDIMFNLGWPHLSAFKKTLDAVSKQDWGRAADELESSLWDKQVGARADELEEMIRHG